MKLLNFKTKCFLLLLIPLIFFGCKPYAKFMYETVSFKMFNSDNGGQSPLDVTGNEVQFDAYAIHLKFNSVLKSVSNGKNVPSEMKYENEDKLSNFQVVTLTDFDNTHLAGSSMNDYFVTGYFLNGKNINDLIEGGELNTGYGDYNGKQESWESSEILYLMQPPLQLGLHRFQINISFSDGRVLKDSIDVNFIP